MTGLSILLLDTEPRTHNHYIVLAIADALRRHPDVARVVVAHHGDALATFVAEGLDTFLAFGGAKMHAPLLGRLARLARLSILWTTEDPYERSSNVRFSDCFDIVFTNDRSSVAAYEGRAVHLPLAASPALPRLRCRFRRPPFPLRPALHRNRLAQPCRQPEHDPGAPARRPAGQDRFALERSFWGRPTCMTARSLRNGAAATSISHAWRTEVASCSLYRASSRATPTSRRPDRRRRRALFETALAGGFQVMVSPEPEVRDYYTAGAEFLLCTGDAEAAEAIASMLAAPEKRLAQARAARARTLANTSTTIGS